MAFKNIVGDASLKDASITVQARKFDQSVHRQWQARLLRQDGSLIVVEGVFADEIRHSLLGTIAPGTISTEYYWTDRWYSVFRFREPTGELRNYYCNINQPAEFDGNTLSFVDLDIDVLIAPDFSYRILDEDEFMAHAKRYDYPTALRAQVSCALAKLIESIEGREYPFDWHSNNPT
jgi:hypothetical protein